MLQLLMSLLASLVKPLLTIWQRRQDAKKIEQGFTNQHKAEADSEHVTDRGYADAQQARADNDRLAARVDTDSVREQSADVSAAIAAANRQLRGESAK